MLDYLIGAGIATATILLLWLITNDPDEHGGRVVAGIALLIALVGAGIMFGIMRWLL